MFLYLLFPLAFNSTSSLYQSGIFWGEMVCFSFTSTVCVCVCVCVLSHVWLFCKPMDHSLPGSSVHGILQARILEWVAMPSSRGSSQPRDATRGSCIAGGFFICWDIREPLTNTVGEEKVEGKTNKTWGPTSLGCCSLGLYPYFMETEEGNKHVSWLLPHPLGCLQECDFSGFMRMIFLQVFSFRYWNWWSSV